MTELSGIVEIMFWVGMVASAVIAIFGIPWTIAVLIGDFLAKVHQTARDVTTLRGEIAIVSSQLTRHLDQEKQ